MYKYINIKRIYIIAAGLPGIQAHKDSVSFYNKNYRSLYFANSKIEYLYICSSKTHLIIYTHIYKHNIIFFCRYVIKEEIIEAVYAFKDKIGTITSTVSAKVNGLRNLIRL